MAVPFVLVETEFQSKLAEVNWFCANDANYRNIRRPDSRRPFSGMARQTLSVRPEARVRWTRRLQMPKTSPAKAHQKRRLALIQTEPG